MSEKLEIRKGGKLFETCWIYNKETEEGHYEDTDVTEYASRFLFDVCEFESGITLKDIFLLLNSNLDIFDSIIGNWCKEIVTEGLTGAEKPYTGEYNIDEVEYLELSWNISSDDDVPSFTGYHRPDLHGMGFELKEDKLLEWGDVECPKGKRQSYAVEMSPTNEMINFPVVLNNKFEVYEDNHKKDNFMSKITEYQGASFTLGNILEGIMWELSFYGKPEKRDEVVKDIKGRIADYEKSSTLDPVPNEDAEVSQND